MHYESANLGQNGVKMVETVIGFCPNRSFVSGSKGLCQVSSKSDQNCDRESADTQTHTQRDDTGDLIICPVVCCSNETDKYKEVKKTNVTHK